MNSFSSPIYAFSAPLLDGSPLALQDFQGQVLLIVNTASRCGFTPQYAALEALFEQKRTQGFTVLAFPCNQFGGQEPGSATEIGTVCQKNYGVTFPVFAKIEVNGPHAHPLYRYLKEQKPGLFARLLGGRIGWNFTKFLVDRRGRVVARFAPSTPPTKLGPAIDRLLAGKA
jgi:glutathione peroxidase